MGTLPGGAIWLGAVVPSEVRIIFFIFLQYPYKSKTIVNSLVGTDVVITKFYAQGLMPLLPVEGDRRAGLQLSLLNVGPAGVSAIGDAAPGPSLVRDYLEKKITEACSASVLYVSNSCFMR